MSSSSSADDLDGRWGPPLPEYLDRFNQRSKDHWLLVLSSESMLEEKAQKTISRLRSNTTKPWVLLEDVLLLTTHHKYMNVLITPYCRSTVLKLFKEYEAQCEEHMFTQYTGFLCVHLIIRMIEFGMITNSRTLEAFEALVVQADNHLNITDALTKYALSLSEESLTVTAKEGYHWLFDRVARKTGKGAMPLGNMPFDIIKIVHRRLWDERKYFSLICTHTYLPGWTCLWFAAYIYLKEAPDAERKERDKLMGLMYRFMLVSNLDDELAVVARLLTAVRIHDGFEFDNYYTDPVDEEDARVFAMSFIRFMEPGEGNLFDQPVKLLLALVNACIFESNMFVLVPHLGPACWRAAALYVWAAIKENGKRENKDLDNAFGYARRGLMYGSSVLDTMMTRVNVYRVLEVYHEMDVVNMLAQTLFRPLQSDPSTWAEQVSELSHVPENVTGAIKRMEEAECCVSLEILRSAYKDWSKAYQFSLARIERYKPGHPLHTYPDLVWGGLRELGEVLGFSLEPRDSGEDKTCAYNRCPDPKPMFGVKFSCGRCCVTMYCSTRCQSLDWARSRPIPHKKICRSLYYNY